MNILNTFGSSVLEMYRARKERVLYAELFFWTGIVLLVAFTAGFFPLTIWLLTNPVTRHFVYDIAGPWISMGLMMSPLILGGVLMFVGRHYRDHVLDCENRKEKEAAENAS